MSFTCPRCGATSYHPEDERNGYCGRCHDWTALKAGDVLRLRKEGSGDGWCICQVLLASTNGLAIALRVVDGMVRVNGGWISGAISMQIDAKAQKAFEVITNTELEVEIREHERRTN